MASSRLVESVALFSLHSSPLAPPGTPDVGGMNVHVLRLADGMAERGVRVDVFTRRDSRHVQTIVKRPSGARIIHLSAGPARAVPKRLLPLQIPSMVSAARAFFETEHLRYDLFHSHYWLSGLAAVRLRDDPRVPVVHMFHTLARVKEEVLGQADERDSQLRIDGERCLMASADAVVGATPQEREVMLRLYGRAPARYATIPCGVDLQQFRPHDRALARSALAITGDRLVLFVGRLDRIKGMDTVLHAVAAARSRGLGDVRLLVLGGFESDQERSGKPFRSTITSLGLEDAVEFRGVVPQSELPLYYSAADVCAMPSAYESFGMVAIESMACQTPVVGFATGGLSSTIQNGRTGYLAPAGDIDAYADRLCTALTDSRLTHVGRQARFAMRPYDWPCIVDCTLELYEQVYDERFTSFGMAAGQC